MSMTDITIDHPSPGAMRVTISRPEVRNAYRSRTCHEIVAALDEYARDDQSRVLVLTGSDGAFCSGGDLKDEQAHHDAQRQYGHGMVLRRSIHQLLRALRLSDKPIVAAIDGAAISGGLAIALCCDLRIASSRSRLGDVSTRAGLIPDDGGTWLFPRAMGTDRALRMTLLGEVYDAHTAKELGLVTEVVEHEQFAARVDEVTAQLARSAPLAMRASKRLMTAAAEQSFESALGAAELAVDIVNESTDAAEGIAAFTERRTAHFTGH